MNFGNPDGLRRWLQAQDPDMYLGHQGTTCPMARYLTELNGFHVSAGAMSCTTNAGNLASPYWMVVFITNWDSMQAHTARQALALMNRIFPMQPMAPDLADDVPVTATELSFRLPAPYIHWKATYGTYVNIPALTEAITLAAKLLAEEVPPEPTPTSTPDPTPVEELAYA